MISEEYVRVQVAQRRYREFEITLAFHPYVLREKERQEAEQLLLLGIRFDKRVSGHKVIGKAKIEERVPDNVRARFLFCVLLERYVRVCFSGNELVLQHFHL